MWKILVKMGIFPQVGLKKNIWNYLVTSCTPGNSAGALLFQMVIRDPQRFGDRKVTYSPAEGPRYTWKGICVMMLVGCTATTRCAVLRPGSTWTKNNGGRNDSPARWALNLVIYGVIITPINVGTRWVPTRYNWGYKSYKMALWMGNWGHFTPIIGGGASWTWASICLFWWFNDRYFPTCC